MWQALLAAAVAGSTGFVAKHFLKPCNNTNGDLGDQNISSCDLAEFEPQENENDAIFRFSSGGLRSSREKKTKKKKNNEARVCVRSDGSESEKKNYGARRFGVSLKRRKICRNVAGKRASFQDPSLFSWGLGVGMMCMMSAGKAEFSKLNTSVIETAKVVEELKTELHKRKLTQNLLVSDCDTSSYKDHDRLGSSEIKSFSLNPVNDGEYASSVLTEEPVMRMEEMDQLEAELEFELQKLPWSVMESSGQENSKDIVEDEASVYGFPEEMRQDSEANQQLGSGILPEELDQKLCHLLIERQENQIEDLESELTLAQRKLLEKEAELQALKDCVKRLTEVSLSNFSDDEAEVDTVGSESRNTIVVGMKRPNDSKFM